jgi:CRISPR-associated protein Cmr4
MPTASRILTVFTRTPLHVGAGSSVGAIDQPIVRERHTGLPLIPGSSLKGVLADLWHDDTELTAGDKSRQRTTRRPDRDITWLFGSDDARDKNASAGALQFGEARLVAFPIRSAKGSFAWITSPQLIARAALDGVPGVRVLSSELIASLTDAGAIYVNDKDAPLDLPPANGAAYHKIVLEDYTLRHVAALPDSLGTALAALVPDDSIRELTKNRLVVVSDGMMSHFARTACEVAQHVRINDATGTADEGGLFNQENVPADTLFYSVIRATPARSGAHRESKKDPKLALDALDERLRAADVGQMLQIGADATTGLGFCQVRLLA